MKNKRYNLEDMTDQGKVVFVEFVSVRHNVCEPTDRPKRVKELRDMLKEDNLYIERYGIFKDDKIRFVKAYFS